MRCSALSARTDGGDRRLKMTIIGSSLSWLLRRPPPKGLGPAKELGGQPLVGPPSQPPPAVARSATTSTEILAPTFS